jgi:beta-lactamase regulating signal transducer with metallopeptidase domain
MEQVLLEYLANSLWQLPLLALGAWLLLRALHANPRMQHALWLIVLVGAVLLPLRGVQVSPSALPLPPEALPILDSAREVVPEIAPAPSAHVPVAARVVPTHIQLQLPAMHRFSVSLPPHIAHLILACFAAFLMVRFFRILLAWTRHRTLVYRSAPVSLTRPGTEMLRGHCARLRISVPELRESAEIVSPATVGVAPPILLLPVNFRSYADDEVEAAICHELAHVQRRDYLVNLVAKFFALPVGWHPATEYVQRQIHCTREVLCDAAAARLMTSEIRYANCLLTLARSMYYGQTAFEQAQAPGLFSRNTLEERIMHLTQPQTKVGLKRRALHAAAGAGVIAVTILLSAVLHLTPVMARVQQARQGSTVAPPELQQKLAPLPALPSKPAPLVLAQSSQPSLPAPNADPRPAPLPLPGAVATQLSENATCDPRSSAEQQKLQNELQNALRELQNARELNQADRQKETEALQQEIAKLKEQLNSPEFRKQIDEAARQAKHAGAFAFDSEQFRKQSEQFRKQMEEFEKQLKSDQFKRQIEQTQRSAEVQEQIAEAQKQIAEATKQFQNEDFKREMDKAMKELQKSLEQYKSDPSTK